MADVELSINPNNEMTEDENITAGSGGITFDDLEGLHDQAEKDAKPSKSEPKAKGKEEKKEESDDDDDEEESEEDDEEESDEESEAKAKDTAKNVIDAGIKGKKLQASFAGKDFDLHTGATIPVKIDGTIQSVPIQSLINNYSGKQTWDKKFSELDTDRQDFIGRVKNLDGFIQNIFDKSTKIEESENKVAASFEIMKMIAQLAGKDPRQLWEPISRAIASDYHSTNGMSDLELENWELKRKFELDNIDKDIDAKRTSEATSNKATAEAESKTIQTYGLNQQRVDSLRQYLTSNKLRASIRDVVELDRIEMATEAIAEFDNELAGDADLRDSLIDRGMKDPDFTKEDMLEVLRAVYLKEDKTSENIKRKLGKTSQTKPKKTEPKTPKTIRKSDDLWAEL